MEEIERRGDRLTAERRDGALLANVVLVDASQHDGLHLVSVARGESFDAGGTALGVRNPNTCDWYRGLAVGDLAHTRRNGGLHVVVDLLGDQGANGVVVGHVGIPAESQTL